jgi:hypothetical protein
MPWIFSFLSPLKYIRFIKLRSLSILRSRAPKALKHRAIRADPVIWPQYHPATMLAVAFLHQSAIVSGIPNNWSVKHQSCKDENSLQ